ncbi:hypothetical protein ACHQM5_003293 [Ranunculus cassubicifolius]
MASGTTNLSSKRKSSSSSFKKKSSNKSSEVRKRKRSRSRKRDKSKKLRRRDDSYSDDDSRSEDSLSLSSYSDDDDYKRRKGRSRTREDVKKSKKRVKKRYYSSDDESSVSPIRKKRKESKKKDGSKVKKKSRKRGSRRDASVDSFSSDSKSCSTCRGGSDSEGGDFAKSRRRGRKEKDKTLKKRDKERYRSRSYSPFSDDNEQIRYHDDKLKSFVSEKFSGHLRSVITIPDEYVEGRYLGQDEIKAEVIQAYDDCPSPKSNDSFDGGSKKEVPHKVLQEKVEMHNDMVDDAFTSKSKSIQCSQSSKGDVGAQHDNKDHTANIDLTRTTDLGSSEAEDLELILRQKALENLKKFREHKGGNDIGVKQSSVLKGEPTKIETEGGDIEVHNMKNTVTKGTSVSNSPKQTVQIPKADHRMVDNKAAEKKIINFNDIRKSRQNPYVYRRDASNDDSVLKQTSKSRDYSEGKPRAAKTIVNKIASEPPKSSVVSTDTHKTDKRSATLASKTPIVKKIVSDPSKVSAVSSDPRETNKVPDSAASEFKTIVNKIVSEPLKSLVRSSKTLDTVSSELKIPTVEKVASETSKASAGSSDPHEINEVHGSSAPGASSAALVTGEDGPIDAGNATTGGSGFEEKTMTVMRGGEMVQVSYKVYIPKRAPALARRKLQR